MVVKRNHTNEVFFFSLSRSRSSIIYFTSFFLIAFIRSMKKLYLLFVLIFHFLLASLIATKCASSYSYEKHYERKWIEKLSFRRIFFFFFFALFWKRERVIVHDQSYPVFLCLLCLFLLRSY